MAILDLRVIDQLKELIGGDVEELHELIKLFLVEAKDILSDMDTSLETQDLELLRRSAHSLKSSSQDFGATRLSELNAALESSCRNHWPESAANHVVKIADSFKQVDVALNEYISGPVNHG